MPAPIFPRPIIPSCTLSPPVRVADTLIPPRHPLAKRLEDTAGPASSAAASASRLSRQKRTPMGVIEHARSSLLGR
jgi:hypothetical protein